MALKKVISQSITEKMVYCVLGLVSKAIPMTTIRSLHGLGVNHSGNELDRKNRGLYILSKVKILIERISR